MKKKSGILVMLMAALVLAACGQKAVIIVEKKERCGPQAAAFQVRSAHLISGL